MKKIIASLLLVSSFSVFANDSDEAISTFLNSSHVQKAIQRATSYGLIINSNPQAVFLSGGCGYAGCDYSYLVTIGTSTNHMTNNQFGSIGAVVILKSVLDDEVKLIDTKKI